MAREWAAVLVFTSKVQYSTDDVPVVGINTNSSTTTTFVLVVTVVVLDIYMVLYVGKILELTGAVTSSCESYTCNPSYAIGRTLNYRCV